MASPRIAVVHHWFVTRGGGERVAECIAALLPTADLFALMVDRAALPPSLQSRHLTSSFLQRIPGVTRHHRQLMPLYPEAARSLDLRCYDLVISSDSGPVKALRTRPGAVHLCYCHSPMRYLYDGFESYRAAMPPLTRLVFTATAPRVRRADRKAAQHVTRFLANSLYVAERIRRSYGREAEVIYPPIDFHRARLSTPGSHYLCAGRLVAYKQTELAIRACARLGRELRVAGTGPELERLRRIAGPKTTFLGELSTEELWRQYSECRALLFSADEDFGMVPLEAQSCGRPVIAYGHGGSLETVRGLAGDAGRTGLFFHEQTEEALCEAIAAFEAEERIFTVRAAQENAARFATPVFLRRMHERIAASAPFAAGLLASPVEAARVIG